MTFDDLKLNDREMLEVLNLAKRHGALVMVHAENAECIAWLTDRLTREAHTEPRYHAAARPPVAEREATHRAISLAELVDMPILIVHVSAREAIEQIRWAQGRGRKILAETCPQYLYLTAADLGVAGYEGAKCICSPPPRDHADQEAVWRGLEQGVFSVFSSDTRRFPMTTRMEKSLTESSSPFPRSPTACPASRPACRFCCAAFSKAVCRCISSSS
jgi:dihydropyrimidinase